VALLDARLKRERPDYIVANASVSGDTTAGGAARLGAALERHRPAVVVLELGGNDGLRGLPVTEMKKNLAAMIEQSRKAGARVLLLGMKIPPNYGPDYADAFEAAYADLAKRYQTALVPFLLEDFADKPDFFLPDRIHPTEAAQPLMAERVMKALQPLLK
jgi:acyl-CoA thioesterase I